MYIPYLGASGADEVHNVKKYGRRSYCLPPSMGKVEKPRPTPLGACQGFATLIGFFWLSSQNRFPPRHRPRGNQLLLQPV